MFRRSIVVIVVFCAVLLAACGGGSTPAATGNSSSSAPSAPPAPTTAPTAAPTDTPAPTNTPAPTDTLTPTEAPAQSGGASCLVGTWQFDDMSAYFTSVMSKAGGPAKFVGQEGAIVYTFGADGKAKIDVQNFTAKLEITAQNLSIPLDVKMSGSATADYATSGPDKVTFSNAQTSGLKFSATMNGQEVFSTTPDDLAAAFGISPDPKYNTFTYECSADTLNYTPPLPNAKPVVLKRVK